MWSNCVCVCCLIDLLALKGHKRDQLYPKNVNRSVKATDMRTSIPYERRRIQQQKESEKPTKRKKKQIAVVHERWTTLRLEMYLKRLVKINKQLVCVCARARNSQSRGAHISKWTTDTFLQLRWWWKSKEKQPVSDNFDQDQLKKYIKTRNCFATAAVITQRRSHDITKRRRADAIRTGCTRAGAIQRARTPHTHTILYRVAGHRVIIVWVPLGVEQTSRSYRIRSTK